MYNGFRILSVEQHRYQAGNMINNAGICNKIKCELLVHFNVNIQPNKADRVRIGAHRYIDAQATSNGRPNSLSLITPKFVDINPNICCHEHKKRNTNSNTPITCISYTRRRYI